MRVEFISSGKKLEEILPGVGVVEAGKSFKEFTDDLIEHNQNPYCTTLAIPADLNWYIDFEGDFKYPTLEQHRAFLRFQLALWIYHDAEYTKPIVLNGVTSIDELRLLSGIPNIEAVYVPKASTWEAEFDLLSAANDKPAIRDLLDQMDERGSEWHDVKLDLISREQS